MLAIAGGIIIAVLVLAFLDVILAFGIIAALGLGALGLLVLLYQSAPVITTLIGFAALIVIAYVIDDAAPKNESAPQVKLNKKNYWTVQISGAGAVSELDEQNAPKSAEALKSWSNVVVWHDVGVHHETFDDAKNFARRRYEFYSKKSPTIYIRVVSSSGQVHRIDNISSATNVGLEIAKFLRWAKRKVLGVFG